MKKAVSFFCLLAAAFLLTSCSMFGAQEEEKKSDPVGKLTITNHRPEPLTALWIESYTGTPPKSDGSTLPEANYLEENGPLAYGHSYSVTLPEGSYQVYYGYHDNYADKNYFVWLADNGMTYKIDIAEDETFAITVSSDSWSIDESVLPSKDTGTVYPSKSYVIQ